jgi:small subunit ribosomal protein S14
MRYLVTKDMKRRSAFSKSERSQLVFKTLNASSMLKTNARLQRSIRAFYYSLPPYAYRSRIRNRCLITGRGSSVVRYFRLSRLQLREFFASGYLYGFRRSSW